MESFAIEMASRFGVIFPENMKANLANPIQIHFGSLPEDFDPISSDRPTFKSAPTRSASTVSLLTKQIEAISLLEIHSGSCGNHAVSGTMVGKTFRSGFYWPTAVADAKELVQRCKGC